MSVIFPGSLSVEAQEVLGRCLFLSGLQDASYYRISCNEFAVNYNVICERYFERKNGLNLSEL